MGEIGGERKFEDKFKYYKPKKPEPEKEVKPLMRLSEKERERLRREREEEYAIKERMEEYVIKERIEEIGEVYDKHKKRLNKLSADKVPDFIENEIIAKNKIPEIQPDSLQKVVDEFIKGWGKERNRRDFGVFAFLSLINPTVDTYIKQELREGKKLEEIKPLQTRISTEERIDNLGFRNPDKSNVIIEGPVGDYPARQMRGGSIDVFPKEVGKEIGKEMTGGELSIYSEVPDKNFSLSKNNRGKIYRMEGGKLKQYWPKEEKEKQGKS